jgi:SAM-dependent methyltransferase
MTDRSTITDEVVLLWVARETGVLEALLSTAGTPEEVAGKTDVTDRTARVLTRALADRGFFERVDGTYEPTNRSLGFLTRRDVRSVGSLPYRVDLLEQYLAVPADDEDTDRPENWIPHRLGAVAATDEATVRATVTAAVRERPDADRVLDVGGSPGTYASEFARRGHDVTLCDRPETIAPVRALLAREPVEVVERSYVDENLPRADLALVPLVTHLLGSGDNRRLFERLAEAVAPDGTAVIVDHLWGRSGRATSVALEALARTDAGTVYEPDRYRKWAKNAGFDEVVVRDVPGTDRQAVVANR